jgi:DNA helicase-2/ATP-dependent DNA helicase PcrA
VRHSPEEVAEALGLHTPTEEQRLVIEAPLRPLLVVAGAGSGKTETMAARVVWLVANGLAEPEDILGLTFTRKAATELSERIGQRLAALRAAGMWTPPREEGAETLGGTPSVSTYHAYAGRLVGDHALRLGYEPDARLLSEAAAWQYAAEVVARYDGPMEAVDKAESTITAAVVDLAGELAEHLLRVEDVEDCLRRVETALAAVPRGESGLRSYPAEVKRALGVFRERRAVLPLVERYQKLKAERDAMDFADQMALAARLARSFPDIGALERGRFRAVLLDEFQDTSEAQLALLKALFVAPGEPVPVTAVGDPHQSIYGWRGASATTLTRFPQEFVDPHPAQVLHLSTSWRNDRAVLEAANTTAGPLRAGARVPVRGLRAAPSAGEGAVGAARLLTVEDEAEHIADWLARMRSRAPGTSAAVLCRKRSQFGPVIEALEDRGVPHEVVGLGGLLLTPEVEDIVALLQIVHDPTRGDHFMRLATGPLCRLAAADLDGLAAWSRHQQGLRVRTAGHRGGHGTEPGPEPAAEPGPEPAAEPGRQPGADLAPDSAERPSIVEALEDLPPSGWRGPDGQAVGDVALQRLQGLAAVVARLRSMSGLGLADLVGEAERALGLDIEVLSRPEYTPAAARAHLDAFTDVAAQFSMSADRPTLGGFLAWLDAALAEERGLDKAHLEASTDAVQVMTVHAAKGLEWDVVAVPGLVESSFPAHSANQTRAGDDGTWTSSEPSDRGWCTGLAGVPYPLRGDADGLPVFDWQSARDWRELKLLYGDYVAAGGVHALTEERRLAYVAFTRARRAMLLTAFVWGTAATPRLTSRFLQELVDSGQVPVRGPWAALPDPADEEVCRNPRDAEPVTISWPADPLQRRREAVAGAAAAVASAMAGEVAPGVPPAADPAGGERTADAWETPRGEGTAGGVGREREVELLLRERELLRHGGERVVEVPRHLSTSAVLALAEDRDAFASALRRPMPEPPAVAARRGTAFHAWVEQHYARAAIVDVLDLPGSADEDPAGDEALPAMKERFLASEWASRQPVDVEIAVETVVDGVAVRGRIDAVFRRADGGFTVVDWKTGPTPTGAAARLRALQLAAYRLAFARLRGVDLERVDGAFYYATTGETVWPDLPGEEGLADVLALLPG